MKPGNYEFGEYRLTIKKVDSEIQYFISDTGELQRISGPMIHSCEVSSISSLLDDAESGVYTFYLWPQFGMVIAQVGDKYESASFSSPLVRSLIQCCFQDVLNKAEARWMMCGNMIMHCEYNDIPYFTLKDKDGKEHHLPVVAPLGWYATEEYYLQLIDTYKIPKKYLDW